MWMKYIASVQDRLSTALWEAQTQSTAEVHWQKWYYDQTIGAVNLEPGYQLLVKADGFKGKRKIKDRWGEDTWEVVHQIVMAIPLLTKWQTDVEGHESSTKTDFSLHQRLVFPCV